MKENKLIAEFMGLSIKEGVCYYTDSNDMFPMGIEVEEPYLPYDTSWDWLMSVLKKINLQLNPGNYNDWRMINTPTEYDIKEVHSQAVYFITNNLKTK